MRKEGRGHRNSLGTGVFTRSMPFLPRSPERCLGAAKSAVPCSRLKPTSEYHFRCGHERLYAISAPGRACGFYSVSPPPRRTSWTSLTTATSSRRPAWRPRASHRTRTNDEASGGQYHFVAPAAAVQRARGVAGGRALRALRPSGGAEVEAVDWTEHGGLGAGSLRCRRLRHGLRCCRPCASRLFNSWQRPFGPERPRLARTGTRGGAAPKGAPPPSRLTPRSDPGSDPYPDPSPDPYPDPSPDSCPDPSPDPYPDPSPDPGPDPSPGPDPAPPLRTEACSCMLLHSCGACGLRRSSVPRGAAGKAAAPTRRSTRSPTRRLTIDGCS